MKVAAAYKALHGPHIAAAPKVYFDSLARLPLMAQMTLDQPCFAEMLPQSVVAVVC